MGCLRSIVELFILVMAIIGFKVIGGFEFVANLIDSGFKL